MARIDKINAKQTAKVVAVFYFVISLIFILPIFLINLFFRETSENSGVALGGTMLKGALIIVLPLIYGLLGGFMTILFSAVYNLIAKKIGGIEIELTNAKIRPNKKET